MTIQLGNLRVSDEDLAVIAHVVHNETPEAWATRAFNYPKGGEAAVKGKIARHRASYLAAKDRAGYQTAAQKMAARDTTRQTLADQNKLAGAAEKGADAATLDARIAAEVTRQLS